MTRMRRGHRLHSISAYSELEATRYVEQRVNGSQISGSAVESSENCLKPSLQRLDTSLVQLERWIAAMRL